MIRLLTIVFGVLFSAAAVAGPFDTFPAPPDADISQVGLNMRLNGVRMSSWDLRSTRPVEDILAFYRREWGTGSAREPGYTEVNLGESRLLTHVDETRGLIYTVQLTRQGAETAGQLAVTDLLKGNGVQPETLLRDFPRLGATNVESVLEADEAGWKSRTITVSNTHSVQQNLEQYMQALDGRGWRVEDAAMVRSGDGALSAARGNDRLQLAVTRIDGVTRTIAVWEER